MEPMTRLRNAARAAFRTSHTCLKCGYRHPPDRDCRDAALIAALELELEQTKRETSGVTTSQYQKIASQQDETDKLRFAPNPNIPPEGLVRNTKGELYRYQRAIWRKGQMVVQGSNDMVHWYDIPDAPEPNIVRGEQ